VFEHKRPLFAFILVAVICGIMVGTTMRSQAILGLIQPWAGPSAVVAGEVFAPAAAGEPSAPAAADGAETRDAAKRSMTETSALGALLSDRAGKSNGHRPPGHAWGLFGGKVHAHAEGRGNGEAPKTGLGGQPETDNRHLGRHLQESPTADGLSAWRR
jgi:hypothetical protein